MPKIVDHDEQRRLFAEAAVRLIAREGLDGVTMRGVARESGLSYGSLFHYFSSKDELLMHAVEESMRRQTERVNEYASRYAGLAALEQLMSDDAIIEGSSRDAWLIWQTFLYKAAMNAAFAEMHVELIDGWLGRFRRHLLDAQMAGEVSPKLDVELEAKALWAFSAGIGQMGLIDPQRLPPATQKHLITGYLDRLRVA